MAYRIDPFADPLDVELHREVRRIDTLVMSLPEFHALVEKELGDRRPEPDTINQIRNKVLNTCVTRSTLNPQQWCGY